MADTLSLDPTHSLHLRHAEEYELIVDEAVNPRTVWETLCQSYQFWICNGWNLGPNTNTSKKTPTKLQ